MYGRTVTPLLELGSGWLPASNRLYIKAEYLHPAGSSKSRCVESMLRAYLRGHEERLNGKTIVESTSGNTGLALAYYGREYGYRTHLVVDGSCPAKKLAALEAAGAIVEVKDPPADRDPRQYRIEYVRQLSLREGYIWLDQYDNAAAPRGHIACAREIAGELLPDYCFAAVGTGATLRGLAEGMRKYSPGTCCVGAEPRGSRALSLPGEAGPYMNFGPGFHLPAPYLKDFPVEGMQVTDGETLAVTRAFNRRSGLGVGLSTGMCLSAAIRYIREKKICRRSFVILAADGFAAYENSGSGARTFLQDCDRTGELYGSTFF